MSQLDGSGTLETASELALAAFLRPYALENLTEVVQKLTGGGYSSVDSLRGMDDKRVVCHCVVLNVHTKFSARFSHGAIQRSSHEVDVCAVETMR